MGIGDDEHTISNLMEVPSKIDPNIDGKTGQSYLMSTFIEKVHIRN